jgi:hypothetical protein
MNNSIFVIKPYKWEGLWVFDDANVGLVKEPFVGGADTMIDVATAHIPDAEEGFLAVFSANYFPNAQIILEWAREDGGGNVSSGAWKMPAMECAGTPGVGRGRLCPTRKLDRDTWFKWLVSAMALVAGRSWHGVG